MPHVGFLADVLVLLGIALVAAWILRLIRAPAVIGFLVAGMLIGPYGLGLIKQDDVAPLAELGLVLLLFIVGLELSPATLVESGRRLLSSAAIQIALTAVVAGLLAWRFSPAPGAAAAVIGAAVALSSTAIVLKQMADRGEGDTLAGTITTGTLLLQDVAAILAMICIPLLAGSPDARWQDTAVSVLFKFGVLLALALAAQFVLPKVLELLLRRGGAEFMTLFAVVVACGGAYAAGLAGWSWALGSCIAGMLLAGSDVRHQLAAEVGPFRDVFNALFFVSLGMLVDIPAALAHPLPLAGIIAATLLFKTLIGAGSVVIAGWPMRLGLQIGLGLASVSEFGYILIGEATKLGLLSDGHFRFLVAYIAGTMIVGSLLVPVAAPVASAISGWWGPDRRAGIAAADEEGAASLVDHVLIVGYGLNGQNLSRVLRATGIPHSVVEMNRVLARKSREAGNRTVVGDATRQAILRKAGIATARALVVAINDMQATRRIVGQARAARPDLYILARTRFVSEIEPLHRLGAEQVIPEEFETSIEIFAHLLKELAIPDNVIEAQVAVIRAGRYGMLRGLTPTARVRQEIVDLLEMTATQTYLLADDSPACGRTIRDVDLRAETGVTIIAVVRHGAPINNPPADLVFAGGDVLVLLGAHKQLDAAKARLDPPAVEEAAS